jgi:DNA-binding NarL/FixJ family response regulator
MANQRKSNGSGPPQRILLLESDPRHAERVENVLLADYQGAEVVRADTALAYSEVLGHYEPDVVVSGRVPGLEPRQALFMARERHPEVPFVLVGEGLDRAVVESIRAGAADFVGTHELERLPGVVEAVLAQRAPLRRLSRRQREVFRLLASGVTMRDIASRLGLSRKTVETHRAQVMARLGARHVPELVRLAIRLGIVSVD